MKNFNEYLFKPKFVVLKQECVHKLVLTRRKCDVDIQKNLHNFYKRNEILASESKKIIIVTPLEKHVYSSDVCDIYNTIPIKLLCIFTFNLFSLLLVIFVIFVYWYFGYLTESVSQQLTTQYSNMATRELIFESLLVHTL